MIARTKIKRDCLKCGKEVCGGNSIKYCSDCARQKNLECKRNYNKKVKERLSLNKPVKEELRINSEQALELEGLRIIERINETVKEETGIIEKEVIKDDFIRKLSERGEQRAKQILNMIGIKE
jgi:hypothetical protein